MIGAKDVTVWYDAECPLCIREIALMRRLDRRSAIDFVAAALWNRPSFSSVFMRRRKVAPSCPVPLRSRRCGARFRYSGRLGRSPEFPPYSGCSNACIVVS